MSKYYKRAFLNRGEGTALIEIDYEDRYGAIKITDCSRSISLSFSTSTKKETAAAKFKIDKLIAELTVLQTKLGDA